MALKDAAGMDPEEKTSQGIVAAGCIAQALLGAFLFYALIKLEQFLGISTSAITKTGLALLALGILGLILRCCGAR